MRAFDTYIHINELKKAGFNEEQAAVIIKSLVDSRETDTSHLATREQLESAVAKLEAKISDTHTSTLKWMVSTMIALVGIIIAAIKFF